MPSNEYHFITRWHIPGTIQEIGSVLADTAALPRWWPSVYLDVEKHAPGDENGIGMEVSLYTKGWLPYTLRWRFRVVDVQPFHSVTIEAQGDFVGRGIWTFQQQGDTCVVTYDWKIRADKPLLRSLSFLLKPIFAANHHWAMGMGEKSLVLELARRRARTPAERARIPPPPPPTTTLPLALTLALALVLLYALWRIRHGNMA
jgi:hypothetical protein